MTEWNVVKAGTDYGPGNDWRSFLKRTSPFTTNVGSLSFECVEMGGDGTPIVFLHGIGNTWRFWSGQMETFASTNRVLALDLPGFGGSSLPEGELTAEVAGAAVAALCDQLGIQRCVLVGHSMGSVAALSLAATYPDLVEQVVAVAPALQGVVDLHAGVTAVVRELSLSMRYGFALVAGSTPLPSWMRSRIVDGGRVRHLALRTFVQHPELLPRDVVEACLEGVGSPGVIAVARSARRFDLLCAARQVTVPVLLVNGTGDRLSRIEDVDALSASIASSHVVEFEDTGHWPMIERGPQFNELLANVMAR